MAENHYDVPSWAGKPPLGLHLDVLKDNKLIQKLMIDEKKCYLFGRNPTLNDFCIDHASCSRVHAAFVYHKHLDRAFLVDLGSTHGTFIGSVRIESNKPTQLPVDSTFHFGASTRYYVLREKPNQVKSGQRDGEVGGEDVDGNQANLPENELELDNLTEYNTAHNKRISMLGIGEEVVKRPRKRPHNAIRFKEEEDVINPEDIDPTVGKFRNLVQTAVIPNKRAKIGSQPSPLSMGIKDCGHFNVLRPHYDKLTATSGSTHHISPLLSSSLSLKLGIHLPNPAPEVDIENPEEEPMSTSQSSCSGEHEEHQESNTSGHLTKKKKYAKEAWPGKKPGSFLM